jgi:hypothetical protein
MKNPFPELVIVFKKSISEEDSLKIVKSWNIPFREGMDSSKGKIYFYATGEKYILTFADKDQKAAFEKNRYQFLTEIHQIYEPDWDIQKD